MAEPIDIQEVTNCTCLKARRAARHLSRLYDTALQPAGVTANQVGLLAKLFGARLRGRTGLSVGALAELVGMHPSTLSRDIKPLTEQGLISDAPDPRDGRIRNVAITKKGQTRLREAIPAWRRAQAHVQETLGYEVMLSLNALLDVTSTKLTK